MTREIYDQRNAVLGAIFDANFNQPEKCRFGREF
jgi:hypothetical protein